MKTSGFYTITRFITLGLAASLGLQCAALAARALMSSEESKQPAVLIFNSIAGSEISRDLAASSVRALRTYFVDTRRVEATIVNSDSPMVQRAIAEKKITATMLTTETSREKRTEIAGLLGCDYASAAEISIVKGADITSELKMPKLPRNAVVDKSKDTGDQRDFLKIKVWLSKVDGGPRDEFESTQLTPLSGSSSSYDNTMQTSLSTAVLDLTKKAFAKITPSAQPAVPAPEVTAATPQPELPTSGLPTASDYSSKAEASIKDGNIALAIMQYSEAVSADPSNTGLRIKLAETYARKGLFDESGKELDSAKAMGADQAAVEASRAKIDQMRTAKDKPKANPEPPAVEKTVDAKPDTAAATPDQAATAPASPRDVSVRLAQGDKLWTQGEMEGAADAYSQAIKLNPKDWRGYERLAAVNASMSLFGEAGKALDQLKSVQPNPPDETVSRRYVMFRRAFDKSFLVLMNQLETEGASFEKKTMNRESYYASVNGIGIRLETMAKFLDTLTVPSISKAANLRRSMACGLVSQASASLLDYLETNSKKAKANADTFMAQAKKELDAVVSLESASSFTTSRTKSTPASPSTTRPAADNGTAYTTNDSADNEQPGNPQDSQSPDQPSDQPSVQPAPAPVNPPDSAPPPPDSGPIWVPDPGPVLIIQ